MAGRRCIRGRIGMKLASYIAEGREAFGAVVAGGVITLNEQLGNRYSSLRHALAAHGVPEIKKTTEAAKPDPAFAQIQLLPPQPRPEGFDCAPPPQRRGHAESRHRSLDLFGAADHLVLLGFHAAVCGRHYCDGNSGRCRASPQSAAVDEARRRAGSGDFRDWNPALSGGGRARMTPACSAGADQRNATEQIVTAV